MRICNKCKVSKPMSEFYSCKQHSSGFETRCKSCCKERANKGYSKEKSAERWKAKKAILPPVIKKTAMQRLMGKVEIITETGCWIFMGTTLKFGHGHIGGIKPGSVVLAHRLSYELHVGVIPDGLKVCHKCDIPQCVNPSHLFVGTQDENMKDAVRKGRMASGFNNPRTKLTQEQRQEIKQAYAKGENMRALSRTLPVTYLHVLDIARGKR